MTLTVAEVLTLAADILTPEDAWTQNSWACDANGRIVPPRSGDACCRCLDGALIAVKGTDDTHRELEAIAVALNVGSAMEWNDEPGRTQAEVVAALRSTALSLSPPSDQVRG